MEKRASGEIRVHERKDGQVTYSLRFRVNGQREVLTLGTDTDGWTHRKAERKLDDVLARVRAGVWPPPAPPDRIADDGQTFHVFASRWWVARRGELRPRTQENYEWRLRKHLLPFFADYAVAEIDIALVERYREEKIIEREGIVRAAAAGQPLRDKRGQRRVPLSNESINKTLVTLAQILDSAVERGLITSNPARGKRRRLKTIKPVRRQLEADDLKELLIVAGDMDRNLFRDHRIGRRPMIATMAKSGLRVTEMCRLRWRDVDVHHERLVIGDAKTEAGNRYVDLSLDVMEELMTWRAESQPRSPDAYVFPTASGKPRDKENISRRVLGPTAKRVNELRAQRELPPLPTVTPHALRRTYISLMIEAGAPLPYVMSQVGHADSRTTLEIYAQVQKRLSRKGVHRAFDDLLANAGRTAIDVPTDAGGNMSQSSVEAGSGVIETAASGRSAGPRGPRSGPRK
ncbi:MAG: tyrosine-type recombinase/integrase [Solirubrobacteraceae bacterium]